MVAAGESPESGELRDVLEEMKNPAVTTLNRIVEQATSMQMLSLADELKDRKNRRQVSHRLDRVGYAPVRNPDSEDGLFKLGGRRQAVYARRSWCSPNRCGLRGRRHDGGQCGQCSQ